MNLKILVFIQFAGLFSWNALVGSWSIHEKSVAARPTNQRTILSLCIF